MAANQQRISSKIYSSSFCFIALCINLDTFIELAEPTSILGEQPGLFEGKKKCLKVVIVRKTCSVCIMKGVFQTERKLFICIFHLAPVEQLQLFKDRHRLPFVSVYTLKGPIVSQKFASPVLSNGNMSLACR